MPIVVAVLGIIIVVLGAAFFLIPGPATSPSPVSTTVTEDVSRTEEMEKPEELTVENEIPPAVDSAMETKSYTENVTYLTPARTEHKLAVTLKIANGLVTEADVIYDGGDGFSNPSQERFDGAFPSEVIGKPLAGISLSRVGGASLSSVAFNEAVTKIRAEQS